MLAHLRTNIGAIFIGIVVMTSIPWLIEQRNLISDQRQREAYLHDLRTGPISNIIDFQPFIATEAVLSVGGVSQTSFTRTAKATIPATRRVSLFCLYPDNRLIRVRTSEPDEITIEEGTNTLNIAYSVLDYGLESLAERGLDFTKCRFYWSKIFTLHLATDIDREVELKSNEFRVREE